MRYAWEEKDILAGVELRALTNYGGTLGELGEYVLCKVMFDREPDRYAIMNKRNFAVHSCNLLTAEDMAKKLTKEEYLPTFLLQKNILNGVGHE